MGITVSLENMDKIYERPKTLKDQVMHYCPGCGHGVAHRLVMEIVAELGIQEKTIGIAPVGCSVFAYYYMDIDMQEAAHGRACAVATGVKRMMPDHYVFTYQGDGDLAAIGTNETIHACNRGENITIVFVNNAVYGMTGGQMAPTTLIGQITTTCPSGREQVANGYPIRMSELVAQLPGTTYVERVAVNTPARVRKAKKALTKAFKSQELKKGTSFIEIVSNCPSNWKMTPVESNKWLDENMLPYYPLGLYKDEISGE
ncbi:MAG: 2-oxoglutarate oxidoreductase [Acidobacteria bacterium CG_4_9_14_3_um_filter_49_7]|nr:MAG: 2-oxoglutarate oxidoreductase [Acidobacteria bacterium CG_4_9_14_3_um_filter_49_7]